MLIYVTTLPGSLHLFGLQPPFYELKIQTCPSNAIVTLGAKIRPPLPDESAQRAFAKCDPAKEYIDPAK